MKDEIKEILNDMKIVVEDNDDLFRVDLTLNKEDTKLLLDYITNLQEELKSANESITWWTNRFNAVEKENKRLKELCDKYEEEHSSEFKIWKDERQQLRDYKSRNEKAIEYIKEHWVIDEPVKFKNDLLNILRRSDDDE